MSYIVSCIGDSAFWGRKEQESDSPPNKPPISPNLTTIYNLFMQNEPNFGKAQMNVNLYNTTDYEEKSDWTLGENEPKTNPIKPNQSQNKAKQSQLPKG
jgi:hypothetical protein